MKIEKGHYVPKELITSEAIHEAVVKAFVAAGFVKHEDFGNYNQATFTALSTDSNGIICWSCRDGDPLTIQQLFTAENGLKWPDRADQIKTDDHCVWFDGVGRADVISGDYSPVKSRVLATRQPKEKEVNEALDKAVVGLDGVWPDFKTCARHEKICEYIDTSSNGVVRIKFGEEYIEKPEFTNRAKELGFINGYRWGVEYPTNGKRPELAGDVKIWYRSSAGTGRIDCNSFHHSMDIHTFKITDQRYKPADTSYLQTPAVGAVEEVTQGDLSDLSIAISDAMNAAVYAGKVDIAKRLQEINKDVLAESNKHKAELEKKRVVDAVRSEVHISRCLLEMLYDAGYLRLPANKD
jgi:hypothetical protein